MPKFCPECGAPVRENSSFCESCGSPLGSRDPEPAEEQPQASAPHTQHVRTPTAKTYQCPNCGGVMAFDAESGHIVCNHCGTVYDGDAPKADIPISDEPVEKVEMGHAKTVEDFLERAPWEVTADGTAGAMVYNCPSCAAQIAADQSTVSTECPYCGNNMIVSGIASSSNIPTWVMPFSVTRDRAEERMREHFQHKWYLSRKFEATLAHMQGMYIPYHLYDIGVEGNADYVGYYDEPGKDDDPDVRYYYGIKRAGHASFERIPIVGSSKMPDGHMDAIAPFDFNKLKEFDPGYAAGYLMEVADEESDQCQPRAEERAKNSFESDLKADARRERGVEGIEEVVRHETYVDVRGVDSCVLPVWLMHCTWEGIQMLFAVNGDTGRCVGDLPVDGKRRATTIIATILITLAIFFIVHLTGLDDNLEGWKFIAAVVIGTALVTFGVDSHFMSQMHTAVEATDASLSYDSEGLVVTNRWRSGGPYLMKSTAIKKLDEA